MSDTATTIPDTPAHMVEAALRLAESAAPELAATAPGERRRLLHAVADALDAAADDLVPVALSESHLPEPRLRGELARTTFQLRLLGDEVADGAPLELVVDHADPEWPAGGRPDLRRMLVPVGPTVVFAASNFPFAFSVAGGDTAAALAAGAPVVLKAHPGHPELSARTGAIVHGALRAAGAPDGTFAVVHGEEAGRTALLDARVQAGAFTGSLRGGRALADLAASRPRPIPFHAEMGSVNPTFVTPGAAAARTGAIATGFVASYLLGAGQFCTKPGLLFLPAHGADDLVATIAAEVRDRSAAPLLTGAIATGHAGARAALAGHDGVETVVGPRADADTAGPAPALLQTDVATLLADPDTLTAECFGPTALVVVYRGLDELRAAAALFTGELTATVHGEEHEPVSAELVAVAARFAGRVVWNGWPTGVAVTHAQQHGGPYPATTSTHTSVGTTSIRRFQRPVAYQDVPDALLPSPLREGDSLGLARRVDGSRAAGSPLR